MSIQFSDSRGSAAAASPDTPILQAPSIETPRPASTQVSPGMLTALVSEQLKPILALRSQFKFLRDQQRFDRLAAELIDLARALDGAVNDLLDPLRLPVLKDSCRGILGSVRGALCDRQVTEFSMVERTKGDLLGMRWGRSNESGLWFPREVSDSVAAEAGRLIASVHESLKQECKTLLDSSSQRGHWHILRAHPLTGGVDLDPEAIHARLSPALREPFRALLHSTSELAAKTSVSRFLQSADLQSPDTRAALHFALLCGYGAAWEAFVQSHVRGSPELRVFAQAYCAAPDIHTTKRIEAARLCVYYDPSIVLHKGECPALFSLLSKDDIYRSARRHLESAEHRKLLKRENLAALAAVVHEYNDEQDVALLMAMAREDSRFAVMAREQRRFWIAHGAHPRTDWLPGSRALWQVLATFSARFL